MKPEEQNQERLIVEENLRSAAQKFVQRLAGGHRIVVDSDAEIITYEGVTFVEAWIQVP
jgi:hypothetical protein